MSPRQGSNTLPRAHAESPMRFGLNSSHRRDSGNGFGIGAQPSTANSSASTTPTATPLVHRRSSFGCPAPAPFTPPPLSTRSNVRRSSRTSPSPVRRRTLTPTSSGSRYGPPVELGSYNLSLPRSEFYHILLQLHAKKLSRFIIDYIISSSQNEVAFLEQLHKNGCFN